jgi:F-type H+-transporting ATPase subunit b
MKFIWPFLLKQMHEREAKIADGLTAAEKGQETLAEAKQMQNSVVMKLLRRQRSMQKLREKGYFKVHRRR